MKPKLRNQGCGNVLAWLGVSTIMRSVLQSNELYWLRRQPIFIIFVVQVNIHELNIKIFNSYS
jgi:hypothetical protein